MRPLAYRHTAYPSAWLAGVAGFAYSVFFVLNTRGVAPVGGAAAFFLLVGGILGASALIGLYERVAAGGAGGYGLWSLAFGLGAALAATLHGGYDLANAIHAPSAANSLPSEVDPRGLGTFGLAGMSLLGFSYLMLRDRSFPPTLGYLGMLSGALLVLIYLGRLIFVSPSNPFVLGPAAIEGFIVNPAWYLWLGFVLRRAPDR